MSTAADGDPRRFFVEVAGRYPRAFWLDGGGSRAWSGRRSIVGWLTDDDVSLTYDAGRREVWRHAGGQRELVGDDIFACLEQAMAEDEADWVGYFGYACRPDLPAAVVEPVGTAPDAVWMRASGTRVFEHAPDPASHGGSRREEPPPFQEAGRFEEYAAAFSHVQEELRRGNSYEVNLTYRRRLSSPVDPVTAYLRLREVNPAPYAAYLQHHGTHLLSSSPERFAVVDRHRWVETKPIKGTTPRHADPGEDERLRHALAGDPRYRAENLMIVDLLRNDLSMVCEPGTVSVPTLMEVESYTTVHQLVSTIRGRLRDDVGTLAALRALFPAGSMTGAPKLRTMQIIADVESTPRGVYAGALGWIGGDGRADLGVVIRTLVATPASDGYRYELGTGGGVTVHSDLASEYAETLWKSSRLLSVLTVPAVPAGEPFTRG